MTWAMIGLGAASLINSLYRQNKSDHQVDTANSNNRAAAEMNYKAQQETNEMNYRIFQEQLAYNDPSHLKSLYDAAGLNGSAIVANQGFTPTAAPNMVAPQMAQTTYSFYDDTRMQSGADAMMKSLIDALGMQQTRKEIEKTNEEIISQRAAQDETKARTRNLLKDAVLKDQEIDENDLQFLLSANDVDNINRKNAELELTLEGMRDRLAFDRELRPRVLRQYDDKHMNDWLDSCMKKIDVKYHETEIRQSLAKLWLDMKNCVREGRIMDMQTIAATYANIITKATLPSEVYAKIYENTEKGGKAQKGARKYEWLDPANGTGTVDTFMRHFADSFTTVMSAVLQPLQGLISIGK